MDEVWNQIEPRDEIAMDRARQHWSHIAKPLFSLGKLETAVVKIAGMKRTPNFVLKKRGVLVFCADNGVVDEGVTQTGREVTAVVAKNFTKGNTSVCIMSKVAGVDVLPIDIGVAVDVEGLTRKDRKIAYGTANMKKGPAMSKEQAMKAIQTGITMVKECKEAGYDILATGEMGIGNTTTSSAVAAVLLSKPVEFVAGKGAGLSEAGLKRKVQVIKEAIALNEPDSTDPIDVLAKVGGYDIAGMVGAFLGGAMYHVPIIIDGFISSVAALVASRIQPLATQYMIPSHVSKEPAGQLILDTLGLSPYIICDMCLGEGTGAVAVLPLLDMGLAVYQSMSSFADIHIDDYEVLS